MAPSRWLGVSGVTISLAAAAAIRWYMSKKRKRERLVASSMPSSPFDLVEAWWAEAVSKEGFKARGVVLATSSPEDGATARTLIPHAIGADGILFGTNSESQKARQLKEDSRCEIVWRCDHRQIRIRGTALIGPPAKTQEVYGKLSPSFRCGLQMLRQGNPVEESTYDQMLAAYDETFTGDDATTGVPPDNYTAIVVKPNTFEFYQGGHPGYINDRFLYTKQEDGSFTLFSRLQA